MRRAATIVGAAFLSCLSAALAEPEADETLDALFAQLAEVETGHRSEALEARILERLGDSPSDVVDVLYERAVRAESLAEPDAALDLLDHAVELAPSFAGAYFRRAEVKIALGDDSGAHDDLQRALEREPRHFAALVVLGDLFLGNNRRAEALDAYRRAIALNPHLTEVAREVEQLRIDVEGQGI